MPANSLSAHATAQDLARALPQVLAAPVRETKVDLLCRRPAFNQREFPERLNLTVSGGIEGDYEMKQPWLKLEAGGPDPRIQVSILPKRVLELVWRDRENTPHPGDTIIADLNTSLDALPVGTRLQVGNAILCVSDLWNDGCVKWKVRFGRAAQEWVSRPEHERLRLRGVLCSIEQSGSVAVGDPILRL